MKVYVDFLLLKLEILKSLSGFKIIMKIIYYILRDGFENQV